MLHQHLPNLITRIVPIGRHTGALCRQLAETVAIGLVRLRNLVWDGSERKSGRELRPISRGPRRRIPILIHYHIFKNAGSSFEWALEHTFGQGYCSLDSSSPHGFVSARDLTEFASRHPEIYAISSHQAAPPAPKIRGREVLTSILIRDPIARIRSIYSFERAQQAPTPGAIKAKELGFKEYVEWRLKTSPAMLCNYQVHFCSRQIKTRGGIPGRKELEMAIANLDSISVVGTVARYDEWLGLAQRILSRTFPNISLSVTRQNTTTGADLSKAAILEQLIGDLGESTAEYLLQNNQLDMCLHQIADALLTRRLAEEGAGLALRQACSQRATGSSPLTAAGISSVIDVCPFTSLRCASLQQRAAKSIQSMASEGRPC